MLIHSFMRIRDCFEFHWLIMFFYLITPDLTITYIFISTIYSSTQISPFINTWSQYLYLLYSCWVQTSFTSVVFFRSDWRYLSLLFIIIKVFLFPFFNSKQTRSSWTLGWVAQIMTTCQSLTLPAISAQPWPTKGNSASEGIAGRIPIWKKTHPSLAEG